MNSDFAPPRKALGQNFLQDANIIRKIVDALHLREDDTVLEIGPGRGALTDELLQTVKQLHVVEFDRELGNYWQQRAEGLANLTVHQADILKFDIGEITDGKLKVIGNLPYNISSPVLFHLLPHASRTQSQLFMLQKEVVDRLSASPDNKQYGRLSVMLQYRYQIEKLFTVPPTAFYPPPKVESAIARLTPRAKIENPVETTADFALIVKQAFAQRRKTLRNTLKQLLSLQQIESVGVEASARAETLSVAQFVDLANQYTKSKH